MSESPQDERHVAPRRAEDGDRRREYQEEQLAERDREPDFDPRPVSDGGLRGEYSREQVERWRREADEHHGNWFAVMDNSYGKD